MILKGKPSRLSRKLNDDILACWLNSCTGLLRLRFRMKAYAASHTMLYYRPPSWSKEEENITPRMLSSPTIRTVDRGPLAVTPSRFWRKCVINSCNLHMCNVFIIVHMMYYSRFTIIQLMNHHAMIPPRNNAIFPNREIPKHTDKNKQLTPFRENTKPSEIPKYQIKANFLTLRVLVSTPKPTWLLPNIKDNRLTHERGCCGWEAVQRKPQEDNIVVLSSSQLTQKKEEENSSHMELPHLSELFPWIIRSYTGSNVTQICHNTLPPPFLRRHNPY